MEGNNITPSDLIQIVKRRKWSLILPAGIVFIIFLIVGLSLPNYYKSSATILIEEQEIPKDFVMATVTSYVDQRLQSINQQIMSSTRLLDLINRLSLYPELKDKWTTEEIIGKMREDIKFEKISAEVINPRTGVKAIPTIAFTLSYEGKNPNKVQQVTNDLASFFLQENLKARERQTMEASEFLEDEMEKVKADIEAVDAKISAFKETHINELPEMLNVNLQTVNNLETSIDRLNEQMRMVKEREGYLQAQVAALSPSKTFDTDQRRLEDLRVQLIALQSKFSNEYPDIIKMKMEIEELEKRLKKKAESPNSNSVRPDNPAYVTLSSQLASTQAEIDSISRQIKTTREKINQYNLRIGTTSRIEGAYNELITERNNSKAKYDDLMRKMMEARVAHGLEKEQKGERFTLIDPARFPERPFKPNRVAIILIGIIFGLGVGAGFASLIEFSDDSIHNSMSVSNATKFPVLSGIPLIVTKRDLKLRKIKNVTVVAVVFCSIIITITLFHIFIMDLDVFWAKIMRKFQLM
ncbi:MAG: GumC family protein [Thermodesulfobacteriota bacterium]